MTAADLHWKTASELGGLYRRRELSPVEATRSQLERIERLDPELHSYVTVLVDSSLEEAERAERALLRGEDWGPLHGVPVAVKDLCAAKGVRTTCGSKVLRDWVPDEDACCVERLRSAGAVILGKLALTEGAYATHHPDVTPPVNPWDAGRWTGVSSSGSGVATAAGLCHGSLGTDTGGSIRFPAACCGVVGLKPSYGRVPLHGVFPLAHSLDHLGPMTRCVRDAAALLQVLAGFDARDPGSLRARVPCYLDSVEEGVGGVRIGVDLAYLREGVDPLVQDAVSEALEVLRKEGARIVEVRLPEMRELLRCWHLVTAAEAAFAHREYFPARAEDYGTGLRALLEAGSGVAAPEYARAELLRRRFRAELEALFECVDLIGAPSFFAPAPEANQTGAEPRVELADLLRFTAPYDFSGSPTLSVPCGFSPDGLPLSLQLIAGQLQEELLCRAGRAYERATDWHSRRPPIG